MGTHIEIVRLQQQLCELEAKRAALSEELVHLTAWLPEIRKEFGNPFYYSNPTEPDEGIANYNPHGSHVGLDTLLDFLRVERELTRIKEQLHKLTVDVE